VSLLYNLCGYPALDTSCAIGENLIITAITSSPPLGADPLGCHIRIWQKNPNKKTKPKCVRVRTKFVSPTTNQCPLSSLMADLVHGDTPYPVVGGKNLSRRHLYRPKIHTTVSKVNPPWTSNPTPPVQSSSRLPQMLSMKLINPFLSNPEIRCRFLATP